MLNLLPVDHEIETIQTPIARIDSRRPLLVLLSLSMLFLAACDEGGGSGGGGAAASGPASTTSGTPSAANSIELPPGQATATLGWAPSEGEVESYYVYESRNGSPFNYAQAVSTERATVSGTDGDRVQIVVVAVNESGQLSNGSPPSPQLVFNGPDTQAVTALEEDVALAPVPAAPFGGGNGSGDVGGNSAAAAAQATTALAEAPAAAQAAPAEEVAEAAETYTDEIDDALRTLLIEADARFPVAAISDEADAWLQGKVGAQFSAGVRLVGTGHRNADALRELIWLDSAGQILVSDGRTVMDLASTADIPATFEEGIRLRGTERFIALEDFDGDGIGDWLIEDTATGDVTMLPGDTLEALDARTNETLDALLVGHGDFDGSGREQLVWMQADGRLEMTSPLAPATTRVADLLLDVGAELMAVADLNGDDRDDLLVRTANGQIERMLAQPSNGTTEFVRGASPDETIGDRLLIATLDADEDDRADIAWLAEGDLELWDAEDGARAF